MEHQTAIGRTLFHAHRTREILTVLIRYGFGNVVREVGLDRMLERGRRLIGGTTQEPAARRDPQQVRLRKAMEELGPTFIKLGQILSMRPDLIPPEWAAEFAKLQDEVPEADPGAIKARIRGEFGEDFDTHFANFEDAPFAAASIAQIHRATLHDGTAVVLKVLRPGIHEIIRADMGILRTLAGWAENYFAALGYSPVDVVDQFDREIRKEIDLRHEARSADRFRQSFEDEPNVRFPEAHWHLTTSNVMTMTEVQGTPLSKLEPGQFSDSQRRHMVAIGADAVFRQCLEIGFLHADPHPGNIMALPDSRICFVDCGMVGNIDPGSKHQLADLVHAVLTGDLDRVCEITVALADADPNLADDRRFRADVWEFVSHFQTTRLDQLDIGHMLQEFFSKIRRHRLRCPADLVFLIKAITTIEAVGEQIAPEFDIVRHVRPHIERLLNQRYGIAALRRRMRDGMLNYAELAETLPRQIQTVVYAIRRNRVTVNLEHRGLNEVTHVIEHGSRNIASALILAAMLVGSSILILADSTTGSRSILTWVGAVGFIISIGVSTAMLLVAWLRRN